MRSTLGADTPIREYKEEVGRQNVLNTIFGRRKEESRMKTLVDVNSAEEFNEMLDTLQTKWPLLKDTPRSGEPQFFLS